MLVDPKITLAWWNRLLTSEDQMRAWLEKLYVTEYEGFRDNMDANEKWNPEGNKFIDRIFRTTANDEMFHASLLNDLLNTRYWYVPDAKKKTPATTSVYWSMMDEATVDLKTCCAVFHLGEQLAAERFEVISECKSTPSDIMFFIKKALPDEQYHAAAFKHLAGDEAIAEVLHVHQRALNTILKR